MKKATNLTRSGSVKTLIHKFSASESALQVTEKDGTGNAKESELPAVTVTPPSGESGNISDSPNTQSHSDRVSARAVCRTRPDDFCVHAACKNRITCMARALINVTCV